MPLLQLKTTIPVPDDRQAGLLKALSKLVAEGIGKPEQYVMVTLGAGPILMSGQAGPAAFADVRSIGGLGAEVNKRLSRSLCQALEQSLGIPPGRVYINFTDVAPDDWGWRGDTFG